MASFRSARVFAQPTGELDGLFLNICRRTRGIELRIPKSLLTKEGKAEEWCLCNVGLMATSQIVFSLSLSTASGGSVTKHPLSSKTPCVVCFPMQRPSQNLRGAVDSSAPQGVWVPLPFPGHNRSAPTYQERAAGAWAASWCRRC